MCYNLRGKEEEGRIRVGREPVSPSNYFVIRGVLFLPELGLGFEAYYYLVTFYGPSSAQ